MMQTSSQKLHEAWALASLMRGRYGVDALAHAMDEAKKDRESAPIWNAIVECLAAR